MHRDLIERYAKESGDLRKTIAGLSREQLLAVPVPGTWSIQQIAIHIVDSDLVLSDRMKRVIAEDVPLLIGFNENKFVENLRYDDQDAQLSCDLFENNRRLMTSILHKLPDHAFDRTGIHSERGKLTLTDLLANAVNHLQHHLKFVREKRAMVEKGSG